jgi:hypothetical protein
MISLSVIKVKFRDKTHLMTRAALDHIREQITSIKGETDKDTKDKLDIILKAKHKLPDNTPYSLVLDTVKLNSDVIYVYSTRHTLNQAETARLVKVVNCAMTAPNTLLVFPDYIVISDLPQEMTKTRKRGKKHDPAE